MVWTCILHRPFGITHDRHELPERGFAPHGRWRTLSLSARCGVAGSPRLASSTDHQRRGVPRLCRTAAGGGLKTRRYHHHEQSRQPQIFRRQNGEARLWHLPPDSYSPDFNPIKQVFAEIDHAMRIPQMRTLEDSSRQIGSLLATIKPDKCQNYFTNAGYASAKM